MVREVQRRWGHRGLGCRVEGGVLKVQGLRLRVDFCGSAGVRGIEHIRQSGPDVVVRGFKVIW